MDDDGQVQLRGQGQLGPEHPLLELPGGVLGPVVVQPDLSHGHHLGLGGQLPQPLYVPILPVSAVLRVDPHGGVDKGVPPGQLHGRPGAGQVAAGVDHQLHPLAGQGGEQLVPVGVKLAGIVVGVGVKQCHAHALNLTKKELPYTGSPPSSSGS